MSGQTAPFSVPTPGPAGPLVLHVRVVSDDGGGPDKTILNSARYFSGSPYRMAALYLHPRGSDGIDRIARRAKDADCKFIPIPESGPVDPFALRRLHDWCRTHGVTVWHGHDHKSNVLGLLLRRHLGLHLVSTVHGWTNDTLRARLYRHVDQWALRRYHRVIVVSPRHLRLCRRLGIAADRLRYIPNAIQPPAPGGPTRAMVRRSLGAASGEHQLVCVGRLSREKGLDRAVAAFAQLRDAGIETKLHLVGDGPQRAALDRQVRQLDLVDHVRFHGWQDDVQALLVGMDLLLLTSHTEAAPNVLLEAMAAGVPVAATPVGNVPDLLEGGTYGLILSGEPSTWPGPLHRLLHDAARRQQLAARSRTHVATHFGFDQRMAGVMAVYDELLGPSGAAVTVRRAA